MFSNWPRSEEEKKMKTETEGRERSGMAGLVSAWLRVCANKPLCMQLSLHVCNVPHRPTVHCLTSVCKCITNTSLHPQIPVTKRLNRIDGDGVNVGGLQSEVLASGLRLVNTR